jgi:hypothetical protein
VGSASVRHRSLRSSGETVARLHAPRTGRLSRLGQLRGVHGLTRQSPARGLGSMSRHRFRAQGFITEPPWTLRFHNPRRHNASKHVSPRNQHGSAGLTAGPRSSRDWLAWRTQGSPLRRHAGRCPDIAKLRSTSGPPSRQDTRSIREVWRGGITFRRIFSSGLDSLRRLSRRPSKVCWVRGLKWDVSPLSGAWSGAGRRHRATSTKEVHCGFAFMHPTALVSPALVESSLRWRSLCKRLSNHAGGLAGARS